LSSDATLAFSREEPKGKVPLNPKIVNRQGAKNAKVEEVIGGK
jgi:hypothetical protein